jgi:hypothetical protein
MHEDATTGHASEVIPLMRKQASLFTRLEGFALRQRMLVVQEDTRPLLALLAERQKLSLELAQVSRRLAPVRENWNSFRDSLSVTERKEAACLLDEMRESLSRVIESDEQDARSLGMRKQIVRQSLQASQAKGVAVGAYQTNRALSGRRLDEAL